jgi:hypothetical protein
MADRTAGKQRFCGPGPDDDPVAKKKTLVLNFMTSLKGNPIFTALVILDV